MNNGHGYYVLINSIDDILRSMDRSLNVTMVNQLLRSDDVTVTLQWPREPGAVYSVNISPDVSHIESPSVKHNIFTINLTISYNIQYNLSIVSSLCGVTATKVLNYGKMPIVHYQISIAIYDNLCFNNIKGIGWLWLCAFFIASGSAPANSVTVRPHKLDC